MSALRPKTRSDIQSWILFEREDETLYCVGSKEKDRYIVVPESKLEVVQDVLKLFDGTHTVEEVKSILYEKRQIRADVEKLYQELYNWGLLEYPQPETVEAGEFRKHSAELLKIDIFPFIERIFPYRRILYLSMLIIGIPVCIVGFILLFYYIFFENIYYSPDFLQVGNSYIYGLLLTTIFGNLVLLAHEIAHGVAACYYGIKPRFLTVYAYLYFLPFFIIRIYGLYTIPRKERIVVLLFGSFMNIFMFSLCMIILFLFNLDGLWNQLLWKIVISNLIAAASNFNPLLPGDGYYILVNLLKMPNIRTKGYRSLVTLMKGRASKRIDFYILYFAIGILFLAIMLPFGVYWLYESLQEIVSLHSPRSLLLLLIVFYPGILLAKKGIQSFLKRIKK